MRILCSLICTAAILVAGRHSINGQGQIPMVNLKRVEPAIIVDLRYATPDNIAGRRIYPSEMPALVRPELVPRIQAAAKFLRNYDYRLKIWDAYRPQSAQKELWHAVHDDNYVANPEIGAGSMHSWGVAVDCTLADLYGRPVQMPTDFDNFTPAAMSRYIGGDPAVSLHLHLLQIAMSASGFYGFYREWWHFSAKDWPKLLPPEEAKRVAETLGNAPKEKL